MDKLILIDNDGDVVTLHADDLPDFGRPKVGRASHVEPGLVSGSDGWDVVLSDHPRNGAAAGTVVASGIPLDRREEALRIEADYIQREIMGG